MNHALNIAIICSCHFNAIGIALSLREVGWQGPIVCLKINSDDSVVAERFPTLCECWSFKITTPEQLPRMIEQWVPPTQVGAVFFCDERFLTVFSTTEVANIFPHSHIYAGPQNNLDAILDRRLFYQKLQDNDAAEIPLTVDSQNDPFELFGDAFRTRVWRSWRGMGKLPRGRTISSTKELRDWKELCEKEGLSEHDWGYQQLLSATPKDVVSVCGWHAPVGNIYRTTRWLKQSGENGWLVEAIDEPSGLWKTTNRILDLFQFSGPFEMEYVRHRQTGKFHVIELNPRFWMQHRLVGNVLVRRYLGLPDEGKRKSAPARYWINTDSVLSIRSLFGHPDVLKYFSRSVWSVPLRDSIRLALLNKTRSVLARISSSTR